MIHRQYGEVAFECDSCDEVLETGVTDWNDALGTLREAGWKSEKVGDEWVHACPRCKR